MVFGPENGGYFLEGHPERYSLRHTFIPREEVFGPQNYTSKSLSVGIWLSRLDQHVSILWIVEGVFLRTTAMDSPQITPHISL